jgi:hypothetical protein
VTIAYHVFFAAWMINRLQAWWGFAALGIYVVAALLPGRDELRWGGAVVAMFVSVCAGWMLFRQESALALPTVLPGRITSGDWHAWHAALLLPPFLMGFGLCPYLDLTFHRARQQTSPAGGRFAFGVGFGVVFCSMIVLTLLYARWLAPAVDGQPMPPVTAMFLCAHLIGQSAFTVAAHARELPSRRQFVVPSAARFAAISAVVVLLGAAAIGWLASDPLRRLLGHDFGEAVYWCFLGFYGLVFPGYLWLQGFRGVATDEQARRVRLILPLLVVIVFPLYWMGFVERRPMWLIPGVLIVLGAKALIPQAPRATPASEL